MIHVDCLITIRKKYQQTNKIRCDNTAYDLTSNLNCSLNSPRPVFVYSTELPLAVLIAAKKERSKRKKIGFDLRNAAENLCVGDVATYHVTPIEWSCIRTHEIQFFSNAHCPATSRCPASQRRHTDFVKWNKQTVRHICHTLVRVSSATHDYRGIQLDLAFRFKLRNR